MLVVNSWSTTKNNMYHCSDAVNNIISIIVCLLSLISSSYLRSVHVIKTLCIRLSAIAVHSEVHRI